MAIGGAFLGGGAEIVPAGFCKLELEILTEDRKNLSATFSIKGTSTYTVTAGADGRAVYTVPAGQTYAVSVNTTGYDNIASQTVVAESGTVRYVRFEASEGRVKRSGDTMTGNLYISSNSNKFVYIKRTDLDRDVEQVFPTSGTTTVGGFIVVDKDGGAIAGINRAVSPSEVSVTLQNSQAVNGTLRHCNLSLKIAKDGSMYATVPTPSESSDNSTKIATTAWVNSADSVVHKTGNETVAGTKTFTSAIAGNRANGVQFDSTVTSRNDILTLMAYNNTGNIHIFRNASGTGIELNTRNKNSSWKSLTLMNPDEGDAYATAPTTPTNATSNEIATADWVNTKLANRVQKLTLNGTISDGVIVTTDIQANDTVFVSITTPSDISPITYAVDIPSTVEGAMLVRSSSHITQKSDGKLYSIDIYAQYRKTAWQIGIIQRGITNGGVSNPAVVSFYGHILRAG